MRSPHPKAAVATAALLVLALVSTAALLARGAVGASTAATVSVRLGAKQQAIQGFGTSQRPWPEPHLSNAPTTTIPAAAQAQILDALYRKLGLTRVRDSLNSGIATSAAGPYNFTATFVDAQAAYIKQARRYGLTTWFPAPVYFEDWMRANDVTSYVSYAMNVLSRFRQDGVEPPYYSLINEPQISHNFPPQWMHDAVLELGPRLRAAGFKTKLVIPDDENPDDAYRRAVAVLQDPRARQYVGALAYHIYHRFGDIGRMRQLAAQYDLPLWMTEYSNTSYRDWGSAFPWAEQMHALLTTGRVSAIDYLWGFFGSWVSTDTMISIQFDGGQFVSWSPTPIYWMTGQYSRFVRPGYVRVATSSSSSGVLASAYTGPGRAVVVATNRGSGSQTVRFRISGGRVRPTALAVQSSATEQWKTLAPVRLRGGSFTATLPPQSITTFVVRR
jgi:glucuronoarabinoxylan endo-1,4-beta-xylanase